MGYFIDRLPKIRWWIFAVLVVLAPFHAFLITWLRDTLALLAVWREILAILICALVFLEVVLRKKRIALDKLDGFILVFAFLSLVFLPFQWKEKFQWMLGFRYDILPFVLLFFVRRVEWEKSERLIRMALVSAAVVAVFGVLHALVLPKDFLVQFGYSLFPGAFRPDIPISACQYLEHTNAVCRAISTFGGPTRYGTYLLLMLGLLAPFLKKKNFLAWGFLVLLTANIILTYSRSIWIGLAVSAAITLFFVKEKFRAIRTVAIYLGIGLALIAGFFAFLFVVQYSLGLEKIFLRLSSTGEHIQLLHEGIAQSLAHPLGQGLGVVGPASVHFQKFLTENWFLQIAIEMGWLGLILFLGILFLISKKLLSEKTDMRKSGLFFALFGIAVAGLFTHSFEETTTTLLLFGLIGIETKKE